MLSCYRMLYYATAYLIAVDLLSSCSYFKGKESKSLRNKLLVQIVFSASMTLFVLRKEPGARYNGQLAGARLA